MPFAESHESPEFKAWLVRTLEPMCDADPVVMSDYIIALLKHEATYTDEQWREFITRELVDFLEDKSRPFVDDLWRTLSTRSFLATPKVSIAPAAAAASQQTARVAAAGGGPAGNGPAVVSSYRPPTAPAGPSRTNGAGAGRGAGQGGKGKCYDYHNRGFCLRGVNCPYEHSDDVIIPSAPDMMYPGMPGRGRGRGGPGAPGPSNQGDRGPQNGHQSQQQPGQPGGQPDFPFGIPFPMPGFPMMPFPFFPGMPNGGQGNTDKNSEFWGSNKPPHHTERTSTLVITDIPVVHLTVPAIREYFAQFGEITNVALEARTKRALVTFGSNREAYTAWKSDDAVFGSRHVKVLWHSPRPGQGELGQKALEASKGLIGNLNKMDNGETIQSVGSAKLSGPEQRLKATLLELELKEKRQKRETLMAEQKVLLARTKTADQGTKLDILKRLKEVAREMEDIDKPKETSGDVEMDEKSQLDKELEKHGMESVGKRDEEELLKLSAQLNALKEKASALGVESTPTRYSPYPTRGGYRGRGAPRGRGRGRGGFGGGQFKLDNRSRAFIVSGEGLNGAKEPVKEWYEGHGGNVEEVASGSSEGWKVVFPNRDMAERVLAMGTKGIPKLSGELKVVWDTESSHASATAAVERDVEMGEETHRGERDEEE